MTKDDTSRRSFDAIVVGNGVIGMSLTLELLRRGLSVGVLGRLDRPFAASAAAGAMNGCFGEVTPSLLGSEYGRLKLELDVRATGRWEEWEGRLLEDSDEPRIRVADGTVVILNTVGVPEVDSAGYKAIRTALDEYREPYEDLDPDEIEWLAPDPHARPLRAMFLPGEHSVDAVVLLRVLEEAIRRAGGQFLGVEAKSLVVDAGTVTGVVDSDGDRLSAGTVVLAAGWASHDLLGALPADVRNSVPTMVSGYGCSLEVQMEETPLPRHVFRTPNRAFACGFHAVPRHDGSLYLGATNDVSMKPRRFALIDDLNLLLGSTPQMRRDLIDAMVRRILVGNRPVPLDGFPLLGPVVEGLWMATGTYRDGLHQSPVLADLLAARITGEHHDPVLDAFTPVRAPLQSMTREQCLDVVVHHSLAMGYEQNWSITGEWPPFLAEQLREVHSRLLDSLETDFVPPPELLATDEPEMLEAMRTAYRAYEKADRIP